MAISPQLRELREQLLENKLRGEKLCDAFGADVLTSAPPQGGWSAASCLAHLNVTAAKSLEFMRNASRSSTSPRGRGPFRARLLVRVFLWAMEPPVRIRTRTKPDFDPHDNLRVEDVRRAFLALHDEHIDGIEELEGLDLDRIIVASPFASRIKYRLYEWLLIMAAHERRHLWQAEQAAAAVDASDGKRSSGA